METKEESNYICYLDLLGIKEFARYSASDYFTALDEFVNTIIASAIVFKNASDSRNPKIHYFSDCCFIESKDLKTLFDFLRMLRHRLQTNSKTLFFSAAVSVGKLDAIYISEEEIASPNVHEKKSDAPNSAKNNSIRLISQTGVSKYIGGTIFGSNDISRVYMLQIDFKGAGIYVDEECLKKVKEEKKKEGEYEEFKKQYISQSFFFPSINTNTVKKYNDLKLSEAERTSACFKRIIEKYYYSNAKNKKYGRFYLPLLANWISSEHYSKISLKKEAVDDEIEDFDEQDLPPIIINLKRHNILLDEIKQNSYYFEYLYFFLLGKIYQDEEYLRTDVSQYFIEKFICSNSKSKIHLKKIMDIPDAVLDERGKHLLIEDHHLYLNRISNRKKHRAEEAEKRRNQKHQSKTMR